MPRKSKQRQFDFPPAELLPLEATLIREGLLKTDARNELHAVQLALYRHLDKTLRE
jgi:hypothetical protein